MKKDYVLLSLPLLLLIGVLVWRSRVEINRVDHLPVANSGLWERKGVYFPSPVERDLLNRHQQLWPRFFSSTFPPNTRNIHKIFTILYRNQLDHRFHPMITEKLREWSVMTNLEKKKQMEFSLYGMGEDFHPKTFQEALKTGFLSNSEACSVFEKERAYRIIQTDQEFYEQGLKYFASCDPEDLNYIALRLNKALKENDRTELHNLFKTLGTEKEDSRSGEYDKYYRKVLWNVVDYALNQELES